MSFELDRNMRAFYTSSREFENAVTKALSDLRITGITHEGRNAIAAQAYSNYLDAARRTRHLIGPLATIGRWITEDDTNAREPEPDDWQSPWGHVEIWAEQT